MAGRLAFWVAVGAIVACACSNNDQADPLGGQYHPPPQVQNPRTCGELYDGGAPSGLFVDVDGGKAGCLVDEVQCSLESVAAFDGVCDAGTPLAICHLNEWELQCAKAKADASTD